MATTSRSELWHDVHDSELVRTGDAVQAAKRADWVYEQIVLANKYRKVRPLRAIGNHLRLDRFGLCYLVPAVIGAVIWALVTYAVPASHWGGIAHEYAVPNAEKNAVAWFHQSYFTLPRNEPFEQGLVLQNVTRVEKGQVRYWLVKFKDTLFKRNLCVLENEQNYYVWKCSA